jgi:hypothetical protein
MNLSFAQKKLSKIEEGVMNKTKALYHGDIEYFSRRDKKTDVRINTVEGVVKT